MDFKKDILHLILPTEKLETSAVLETFTSGRPPDQRSRIASNVLTDIAALVAWGYLEREGPVEEEVLVLTEKAHKEPYNEFDTSPYQYSKQRVDEFLEELCGTLEPSPNGSDLMVYSRREDALQFYYCLVASHASIASLHVQRKIEEFNKLSFWEMANVLYALEDVLARRVKESAKYYARLARFAEGKQK